MENFRDRSEAGRRLAEKLLSYKGAKDVILIALPRGGVVLGYEIAQLLHLPLDIVSPRKIGAPFNPELAVGAVAEAGQAVFSKDIIIELGVSEEYLQGEVEEAKKTALDRLKLYRKNLPPRQLKGKEVILIDDGLATGATMRAAIQTVKSEKAKKIIVAIPVSPSETLEKIKEEVDEVICLMTPAPFYAVGQFYQNFPQTTDEEVIAMLEKTFALQEK